MAHVPKYAVVGQGCAGLASAYHLLRQHSLQFRNQSIHIDMYDAFGIGSGATGVAAGLLHPFGVSGKLLWQGQPAYQKAVDLIQAASKTHEDDGRFWNKMGLFRPAKNEKQRRQFVKNIGLVGTRDHELLHAYCVGNDGKAAVSDDDVTGFYIPEGIVLDTKQYLEAIWSLCKKIARDSNSSIDIHCAAIQSLKDLHAHSAYDAIIIATGAAINEIEEVRNALDLDLCHGYTVEITSTDGPARCTSILGNPYIAYQGNNRAIVGATQTHGFTSLQALDVCMKKGIDDSPEALATAEQLLADAQSIDPHLTDWSILSVRSGVRALPNRTEHGSIPYAGTLDNVNANVYVICGLGARGLVYHSWLGWLTASHILHGDEFPPELTRWKM